jgi:carboxypeptidase Taq
VFADVPALDLLRTRLAELADLASLGHLADWDQRTMMPSEGAMGRAHQLSTLNRVVHDRSTAEDIGGWLDELQGSADSLGEIDRDIVRLARRDWERRRRVPADLSAELAQAAAEGPTIWQQARADANFAALAPALRRNVELARAYAACFDDAEHAYDALLADYDFGVTARRVREVFAPLAQALPPLVAEGSARLGDSVLTVPVAAQKAAVSGALRRLGVQENSWRVDISAHPFTVWLGARDTRITTRYEDGQLESVIGAMHEFGHALYERQIAPELARTNVGEGTSMSMHESQSKLWENHVGRHRAFSDVLARELTAGGFAVEAQAVHNALVQVRPSLIRVAADQLTYPLHIVLRFELEVALIEGSLAVEDLPGAWNDGMRRLLGVEVPNDGVGVLQDIHWSAGSFGYFPSYAMGCLIAAQLWEALELELGSQEQSLRSADVSAIRAWLADRVHRFGRRLDTEPLLEQATGRPLEVEPFLRHVTPLALG